MNDLLSTRHCSWLLADMEVFRSMGSRFNPQRARLDGNDVLIWIGILIGIVLAVIVLSRLLSRQERIRRYSSPQGLFRELCKAHGLDRADRRLLRRLARYHQLAHPARLFLEIERFDTYLLGAEFQAQAVRIEQLRDRLFAEPAANPPAAAAESVGASTAPA